MSPRIFIYALNLFIVSVCPVSVLYSFAVLAITRFQVQHQFSLFNLLLFNICFFLNG